MPFQRPTLPELLEQGATEIESRLPGVLVRVRRSLVGALNRAFNGALSSLYQYSEWLNRQAWPDTAEAEYLPDHGSRWSIIRTPAASATGSVAFTGVGTPTIPAGTVLQRVDGAQYATTVDVALAAGTAIAPVAAVLAGQAGNALIGVSLNLASPIGGVSGVAVASTALAGGADVEDYEPYRARILSRIRKVPQGGADYDYEAWAKEVPGVTRVWVYPVEQGLGTIVIRFVRDDDASPIPDAGEVAAVQAHIDPLRPVTAQVFVVAPIPVATNFTVALTPNTPAVRAAAEAELRAMLLRDAKPGGTILISHIREALSIAAGEANHVLTVPAADVVRSTGQLATMGVVTWL